VNESENVFRDKHAGTNGSQFEALQDESSLTQEPLNTFMDFG
jgi:hypothetical protein